MSAVDEIAAYLAYLKTGGNRIDQIIFDEIPNGEGMTATDELRRLLDERGVEWRDDSSIYGTRRTVWTADGVTYVAAEVSGRLKVSGYLTPAQAVEATLGRGTCHDTGEDDVRIDELNAENAKLRELVQELYEDQCDECDRWKYRDRMHDLGVNA